MPTSSLLRRAFASMALLVPLYLTLACGDSSGPSGPAPEAHAAILVIQESPYRILRADASGRDTVTLVAEPGVFYSGLYPAPDGSIVLFDRCSPGCTVPGDLYHILPTGQGLGPHTGLGAFPKWAPDGTRIGWLVSQFAGNTIVITSPAGANPDTIALAEDFAWSPDGTKLAITYRPTNTDAQIGTIDLAGSRQPVNRTNNQGYDNLYPSWSPSGTLIAFYSTRPSAPGLHVMNADGTAQRLLTAATLVRPVSWSPDGTRVALLDYGNFTGSVRRRVVTLQGLDVVLPPQLAAAGAGFAWSPTGAYALVAGGRDSTGSAQVYLAQADFKNFHPLALGAALGVNSVDWLKVP